jgi:hypothetical protein
MSYTLITRLGTVRRFYILAVAELYQQIHGGVVVSENILQQDLTTDKTCV